MGEGNEADRILMVLLRLAQAEGTLGASGSDKSLEEDAETAATGGLAADGSPAGGSAWNGRMCRERSCGGQYITNRKELQVLQ